jgi:hypothetical protein
MSLGEFPMEPITRGLGFPHPLSNPMVDYFSHSPGLTNISESTCYAHYNVSSFEKGAGLRRLTFFD